MKIQALRACAKQTSMSSSSDDVLGLRGEVEQLRAAINGLRNDLRVAMRAPKSAPGLRLSGVINETGRTKAEARQDAVEALAKALATEFGAPDAQARFGPPMPGSIVANHGSLLNPRGPAMTALFLVSTLLQRQNAPVAPVLLAEAPPAWSPAVTDVDLSAENVTANVQLADLNNTTAIESAADAVLNASAWTTTEPDEDAKNQVESMSDEELQKFMDDATTQAVDTSQTSDVSQQAAAPSAPSPPVSEPPPDDGASRGWGSFAGGALSYIQNNPLAQTVVLEVAKRVKKALGARKTTPGTEDEPVLPQAAAQEPATPRSVDDDDEVFFDASEEQVVDDTTTRAELLLQEAATAPPDSPPGSPSEPDAQQTDPKRTLRSVSLLRVASTATDDDADSQPPSPSSLSSSGDSLPVTPSSAASSAYLHQTLEEAAREHADAACGDAPGERAEVVNEVIRLVEEEKPSVNADAAREHLNGALAEACASRARGILEDALLDAQSLRERVKMLASSFNYT